MNALKRLNGKLATAGRASRECSFLSYCALDPTPKAGLTGHVPAKTSCHILAFEVWISSELKTLAFEIFSKVLLD
jgi:hypothetical protein